MSVLMLLCFMPTMAFAEGTNCTADDCEHIAEIKSGDVTTHYTSLNDAIAAAMDGDKVEILRDCTIEPIEIKDKTEGITIEGNDHTVTGWDKTKYVKDEYYDYECTYAVAIDVYSKVTFNKIKFTNFACDDNTTDINAAIINGYSGCNITITNCSFKKFNRQAVMFAPGSGGSMTVTGCSFDCTPVKPAFTVQKAFVIEPGEENSEVRINNCEINSAISTEKKWTSGGIEIFSGTVTIEDCTLTDCDEGVLVSREYFDNHGYEEYDVDSTVTLIDNTISATNSAVYIDCYKGGDTTAQVVIKSGSHKGIVGIGKSAKDDGRDIAEDNDLEKCSITLTGGYYSAEPAAKYVAGGYYVDASNISGYPYEVKQGTKPEDSTIVIVKDETTPSISEDVEEVSGLTEEDKTAIESKTEVQGVTEAVAGSKNVLVNNSGIDTGAEGVDKVNVDVNVKVELTAAEFSEEKQSMTYTATPVATVTTTNSGGEKISEVENIAVPNSLLSGDLMTVKLPLPANFDLKQIKHTSSDGSVEYFLETQTRGAKTFTIEDNCAVFTITKFSTFELSGTVTYVAPSSGGYYKPVDKTEDKAEDKTDESTDQISTEQLAKVKELADKIRLKARSVKTAKGNIKVRLKITEGADSFKALEEMGYTLKYQFYRSTEMRKNYKYKFETLGAPYTNTDAKKGTRYYYKARIVVYDEEGNLITKTNLRKCWYATRIR